MSNINISVIIPIYDYSVYVPKCLNSISNQDLENIEIILVNNSENKIKELMALYINEFDNIDFIESKDNLLDFNSAINQAKGKYVIFIDSNDYIEKNMLKKLFQVSENYNLDISMCKLRAIDDFTHDFDCDLHDLSLSIFENIKKDVFSGADVLNFITEIYSKPYNKLFKRSFLIKNNILYPNFVFGDETFFYDAFLKANKISIVNENLYTCRFNNRFTIDFFCDDYSEIINAFLLIRDKFINAKMWELYKSKVYNHFIKLILYYFNITSNENKENFYNIFKKNLQNILVDDNILSKLNSNSILEIKHIINSKNHDEYLTKYTKIFSVVIPCFNVEDYIVEAVDSVINQTLDFERFIEIILVDDGSSDGTVDICREFVEKYPNNIRLLHQENGGQVSARNLGLKYVSGKYVNFLDADDSLNPDNLSKAYNFFEQHFNEISYLDYPIFFFGNNYLEFNETYTKIFSVVIPCFNVEDYIVEAVDSVINQTLDFERFIEIILVDDGSSDGTVDICREFVEKYPNNIRLLHQENGGQASARNLGLKYVSGKYVNFLDSDDILMENTLLNAYEFFEKHYDEIDLVAFPMYFFGKKTGNHILNYKFKNDFVVSLDDFWDYPQLSASSAVFKSKIFGKFEFNTNLVSSEDSVMVNKILLEKRAYGVISSGGYCYRKRFDESSTIDSSVNKKSYYTDRLKGYFSELIDYSKDKLGYVPKFIQYLIVYDIQWMFLDEEKFSIFNSEELEEFNRYLRYIFANIEDEVILFHFKKDPYNLKVFMFRLKYDKLIIKNDDGIISLNAGDQEVDILNNHNFYIDIIEIKDNTLFISGVFNSYYDKKDFEIVLSNRAENYYPNYVNYSNRRLSNIGVSQYCFDFEVPIDVNQASCVKLNLICSISGEEEIINLPIKFLNHARMSEVCNYSIWGDYFINFEDNAFLISKYSYGKILKKELSILIKILTIKGPYWTSAFCFHLAYLVLFPFYKNKKIWLVMDRQDRGDDNAEHLFSYMVDINDTKNNYFVISKDTQDYSRLSSIWKNILAFYSIKHRILYLFADKVISSQADEIVVNPFWDKNVKWYSGLLTGDKIFLQHGVAKDDMSNWLRKYDKNVKLLVTTADIEAKSFDEYEYHYNEGVVQVLGLPRYDHLSNEYSNKQILIMPSWRRSLINANDIQIQKSEYFLRFNSLINNKRLINLAKSLGYKIIFKPHPNTFEFIELFDTNDYVIIDNKCKYQELFNNSSLLITDYSSLAFDFAYIKKPLIYYQYGDDYHFDNNFFIYETMGFGEVIADEDMLIDKIEEYLNNDCKIKDVYLERSNSFYKFNDKNNCKRVYEAIKKIK